MVDRAHAVLREELRHEARPRDAVLQHVGDPRRGADVVLEHLPGAVVVAHEVAAGDVAVDAARRADAVRGACEVAARHDEAPRHDPRADDLASVVDVVDEAVQRADALGDAALDLRPLVGRQDPRHEVQRHRALERRPVLARRVERDPLLDEDRVASPPGGGKLFGPERLQAGCERGGVRSRLAVAVEQLVVEPGGRTVGRRRAPDLHVRHLVTFAHTARCAVIVLRAKRGRLQCATGAMAP
ncbi:hypothetical protein BH20ACT16_BH20ACT16_12440 [soil metagenome]